MATRGCWNWWLRLIIAAAAASTWWQGAYSQPQINLLNKGCSQYNASNVPDFFRNLNATFSDLRNQLSAGGGKLFATAEQARSSDPTYAMFQCRNYMSQSDCLACYDAAVAQIRNCSAANGARVIYDGCFLRVEVTASDDSSSPYYIHSGEHPGLAIVSEVLTGSNYNSWSRSMLNALKARNKVPFITGTIPVPTSDDLLFGAWERCNSTVIAWIRNTVNTEIGRSLLYFNTAVEIWKDLYDRFSQENVPRIFQLKQELALLKQGDSDVSSYFTKVRILWDEYREYQVMNGCTLGMNCGNAKSWNNFFQRECVIQFLMGLNESYVPIRGQILLMEPLPNITKVFSLILQEEKQRQVGCGIINPVSELATVNAAQGSRSQYPRHRDRPICSHCGRSNHTVDSCFEIHGFPPGYSRGRGRNHFQGEQNDYAVFGRCRGRGIGQNNYQGRGKVNHAMFEGEENLDSGNQAPSSPISALSKQQCEQIISILSNQLQQSSPVTAPPPTDPPASASCFSGSFSGTADWDG